jgi:16S rRNA (guanine527-N7)-methyltransferase
MSENRHRKLHYNEPAMEARRIAELLEPFLSPADGQQLTTNDLSNISTYIDLLIRWNARINLTAIRDPEQIVVRHFGESLFAARHLFPDRTSQPLSSRPECVGERSEPTREVEGPCVDSQPPLTSEPRDIASAIGESPRSTTCARLSLADVGSGPGFPGLPIKLWAPDISLTLIESTQKKATFLREITRTLTLTNVNIQTARAESLPAATFSVVTLRAVERFTEMLPAVAALVRPGGRLALLIGTAQIRQAKSTLPTFTWSDPFPIPQSDSRILMIGEKVTIGHIVEGNLPS